MKKILLLAFMACLWSVQPLWAEPIVIANDSVSVSTIDDSTIQKIYLGKKSKWEDGTKIVPFALANGNVHEVFLNTYIKKSPSQFSTYWKQMIFSGKGVPPTAFGSEEEMVKYVSTTSGAIGYIDSATPHNDVRVLK